MLSIDRDLLKAESPAARRIASYGSFAKELTVVLSGAGDAEEKKLAGNVRIVASGGDSKFDAFFKTRAALDQLCAANKPDVLSSQDPFFLGLLALWAAKKYSIPFQVQLHTDCFSRWYRTESVRRFFESVIARYVLSRASCIRAVSERVAESVRKFAKVPVAVLPLHVPRPVSTNAERPVEFKGPFSVLTVSRLTNEKQLHVLIDAVAFVPDMTAVILGDGPELNTLRARAASRGVADRVLFPLWKDPAPYYAHAHAYVCLSRYEGYGRSLVEAALAGVPLVSTDVGVVGELFAPEREVLVVPPEMRALASALTKLKNDPPRRAAMAEAARKKAEGAAVSESAYLARYAESLALCLPDHA